MMGKTRTRIRFRIFKDEVLVGEREIDQRAIKIGRLSTHHLSLDDERVAVTHAVIQVQGDEVSLFGLDEARPTLLNGEAVMKHRIGDGDIIQVGPYKLVVGIFTSEPRSKAAVPPAAPGPEPPAPHSGLTAAVPSFQGMPVVPGMPGPAAGVEVEMTESERTAAAARLVDLRTIEDPSRRVLEVIPVWRSTVLDVVHLAGRRLRYTIGEEPTCDFRVPAEMLGGATRVTIASGDSIHYHPFMRAGEVTLDGGEKRPLGTGEQALPEGARARMELGEVTFLVNSVPGPVKPKLPVTMDWSYHSYNGAGVLGVLAALLMVFFFPPSSRALSIDRLTDASIYHRFLLEPHEIIPQEELPEFMTKKDRDDEKEGGKGERETGDEGQMGDMKAKKTDNMYGIKGPEKNPDPHMARDQQREIAKGLGILSALSQPLDMPTSPFGRDEALGNDVENALGALMGSQIGPNFGFGGLGMMGTGSGGGGTCEGCIGVGNWGKIGHGGGGGDGVGYGPGSGGLKNWHKGKVPPPKIEGSGVVKGSLSKEAIRRVIRQHLNEVRFCYEQGLASAPDLEGRVTVAFVIAPTGTVMSSKVDKSTLGSGSVEACIAKAVRRWTFPSPEDGGVVYVSYPFMLKPAGDK